MSMNGRTHAELLPEIRAENEAWRARYLPLLRERTRQAEARRAAGREALAKLAPEERAKIVLAYGGEL
ncbi:hypothetical protein P1X14_16680 [Sphingomonas sp. AOB5]|uniref:hypothetical protein n=1 Tax=Sphingomonas sp. AOB5 TaxID=3034017 RepID=UPI0023F7BD18|nr:hypothetical protein [Sphingomonas sp. AOB5]MDF7776895.1 hypothetical protein [Sphingomonas sp. AOB5]